MADETDTPKMDTPGIEVEALSQAIGNRYLTYALSTIMHRALPDARDGLKPVHRRILYAMRELRLSPTGGFRKSAKISGDVMGNYHPHGNQAIYDAMARLAQDFALRYPLVDGQGNFGNIDGDNPAAERYTEARLTAMAEALMEGLDEDAVDFRPNYDGTLDEPVVLPAAFPNLLANGASGIAVGMATNIPPHNLGELCDACIHLAKAKNSELVRDDTLSDIVTGPDFPTGGIIVEDPAAISAAYRTGRGAIRTRARWSIEELGRGQWQAVVTEIPFQVPKGRLIEKLAELIQTKKLPLLADVRDESTEDIRIILEPRSKNVDPQHLMNMAFRASDLETRFSMNLNVLIDGVTPRVSSLKEVLRAFLDHRREVLERRTRHRVGKIEHRLHVLEGFITAFLNLDRVIDIIRYDDNPKAALMREDWSRDFVRARDESDYQTPPLGEGELSEVQVEAILNMRLRALRRLEELELTRERDALIAEWDKLQALLGSGDLQWKAIADELRDVKKKFADARRTTLDAQPEIEEVPLEVMIEREPITVVCSEMGWIRAMKGHIDLDSELKFKDGDAPRFIFHAETVDRLLLFGENGRFYTLPAASLPGGRGMGEPVRLMVDLPNEAGINALFVHRPGTRRLIASTAGDGFVVAEDEIVAQTRAGKQALNLRGGARARVCVEVAGDHVASVGENRKLLIFPVAELPQMTRGKGIRMQKFKDGGLSDATVFTLAAGLSWRDPAGRTRTVTDLAEWIGPRASAGRMAPRGFPQDNRFT